MIYLCHADGRLPNLALMRLGSFFISQGEDVRLLRSPAEYSPLLDPKPSRVFGSSIFTLPESAATREAFDRSFNVPVVWGGTGVRVTSNLAEIDARITATSPVEYRFYPAFSASIGFITTGCRLDCGFCVVRTKEGKLAAVALPMDIWRGEPWPRHLEILDNDAFAKPLRDHWREAVKQLVAGKFRVCFSQGLNLRLIDDEAAALLAQVTYTDHSFSLKNRTLYTAWDNLGDERTFRRGIDTLARAGIPAGRLTVYMLVGYREGETWDEIFYRFAELRALGCDPYPMVYDRAARPDLCAFQRWAIGNAHGKVPWPEYTPGGRREARLTADAIEASDSAWRRVVSGWKPVRRLDVAS